ncbi:MAG: hypothetical protein LBQ79_10440, partial [Deltaproteobacteria bacterium]|nr:hypothetical protein [Deltaproteobacteria bacterium]
PDVPDVPVVPEVPETFRTFRTFRLSRRFRTFRLSRRFRTFRLSRRFQRFRKLRRLRMSRRFQRFRKLRRLRMSRRFRMSRRLRMFRSRRFRVPQQTDNDWAVCVRAFGGSAQVRSRALPGDRSCFPSAHVSQEFMRPPDELFCGIASDPDTGPAAHGYRYGSDRSPASDVR